MGFSLHRKDKAEFFHHKVHTDRVTSTEKAPRWTPRRVRCGFWWHGRFSDEPWKPNVHQLPVRRGRQKRKQSMRFMKTDYILFLKSSPLCYILWVSIVTSRKGRERSGVSLKMLTFISKVTSDYSLPHLLPPATLCQLPHTFGERVERARIGVKKNRD